MPGEDTETLRKEIDELRADLIKMQKQHIKLQESVYEKELQEEDNWRLLTPRCPVCSSIMEYNPIVRIK